MDDDKTDIVQIMQRIVLDEFAPKTVVVDETGQRLLVCGNGKVSFNRRRSLSKQHSQDGTSRFADRTARALAEAKAKRRRVTHEKRLG
ncbi:MAG: hypothetical protein R3C56_21085 [Pirellulaceae bacterium]